MDDDDDAWSYSFPPSKESLPLPIVDQPDLLKPAMDKMCLIPADSPNSSSSLISLSKLDLSTVSVLKQDIGPTARSNLTIFLGKGPTPLALKANPADPHTTIEDAGSVMSKESTNALAADSESGDAAIASVPSTPAVKSDFSNSIRIWQEKQEEQLKLLQNAVEQPLEESQKSGSQNMRASLSNLAALPLIRSGTMNSDEPTGESPSSPKIITYRKKSHQRTQSDSYSFQLSKEERYDPKLYVDEKFRNTNYRYATIKRNVEFHQVFRSLDLTDRLLDDFACALSREILLQGRIYVTEHSVCFNSNLLGWVTSLVVPFEDIIRIDKKSTAGLFPNGISIETKTTKHNFASFLSRDATFEFIRTVWLACTGKSTSDLDIQAQDSSISDSIESQKRDRERKISSYILSIDGDDVNNDEENDLIDVDGDSDDSENHENSDVEDRVSVSGTSTKKDSLRNEKDSPGSSTLKALKPDSRYQNLGPDAHAPTEVGKAYPDSEAEIEVCNEIIEAPLGIVFDILFGSADTSFQRRFLETHDASEIDEYSSFHPAEDNPSLLERSFTYRRELGYSIGPKWTKCIVREVVEHLNFEDYAVVLNTTATPDVPSGGSFTVNTRYYFTWGPNNTTNLRIAYFVKWTGRSWIKNVVEKLTLSAQSSVTKDMIEELRKEIDTHTHSIAGLAMTVQQDILPPQKKPALSIKTKKKKVHSVNNAAQVPAQSVAMLFGLYSIVMLLTLLVWTQWRLARSVAETKALVSKEMALSSSLLGLLAPLRLSERTDRALESKARHRKERASNLARQALLLLQEDTEDILLMGVIESLL